MTVLKRRIEKLNVRFRALSVRERVLVTLVMLALICFCGEIFLLAPLEKHHRDMRLEADNVFSQIMVYQAEFNKRVNAALHDPALTARDELAALRQKNLELDTQLREMRQEFKIRKEPVVLLQELLRENCELRVVEVKKGEAEPFSFPGDVSGSGRAALVRQTVEIELEGSFMTFLEYLQTIEKSPLLLFWDDLELRVVKYPVSRFVLKLHTLSPLQETPDV